MTTYTTTLNTNVPAKLWAQSLDEEVLYQQIIPTSSIDWAEYLDESLYPESIEMPIITVSPDSSKSWPDWFSKPSANSTEPKNNIIKDMSSLIEKYEPKANRKKTPAITKPQKVGRFTNIDLDIDL